MKKIGVVVLMLLVFLCRETMTLASANATKGDSELVVDVHTGTILHASNIDEVRGIAQIGKWMTLYLVLEAIEEGTVQWDQIYTVSPYVAAVSQEPSFFDIPLDVGEAISVQQLYDALTIVQSTAASIALAEVIAGDELTFVQQMNEKAKALQLDQTWFTNASGDKNDILVSLGSQNIGEDDEPVSTARSVARLMYHLYTHFPLIGDDTSRPTFEWKSVHYPNRNTMLEGGTYETNYVDGAVLGESGLAGYSLTATGKRGKQRLLAVILDSKEENVRSETARYAIVSELFERGFHEYDDLEVVQAGMDMKGYATFPIQKGTVSTIPVVASTAIRTLVPSSVELEGQLEVVMRESQFVAPIEKGTVVGYAYMTHPDEREYRYIVEGSHYVELVAATTVERRGTVALFFQAIGQFFKQWWSSTLSWLPF